MYTSNIGGVQAHIKKKKEKSCCWHSQIFVFNQYNTDPTTQSVIYGTVVKREIGYQAKEVTMMLKWLQTDVRLCKTHLLHSALTAPLNGLNLQLTQLSSSCVIKAVVALHLKEYLNRAVCWVSTAPAVPVSTVVCTSKLCCVSSGLVDPEERTHLSAHSLISCSYKNRPSGSRSHFIWKKSN